MKTTDPGRALVTGKCRDIGKVKVPILRGLAARAPYFHTGSAVVPALNRGAPLVGPDRLERATLSAWVGTALMLVGAVIVARS